MGGEARVVRPNRSQLSWDLLDLEALLPMEHRARIVWNFVEGIQLDELYARIGSREGEAGRPAADPAVLVALWLYATVEGVGSARELDRLCRSDIAYRWLCGGVPVNHHGLSDFRVGHADVLDQLLTQSVTALLAEGIVGLEEVALDGTKVRASAGRDSFKNAKRLAALEHSVAARVARLKQEIDEDPGASNRRGRAAQERAVREVSERAGRARAALDRLQKEKERRAKTHPKDETLKAERTVSLTDPDARRMRFHDGAIRAAYNVQVAAAPASGIIIAITATDRRNDTALAVPMVAEIERRYGRAPKQLLVDTSYATQADIVTLADRPSGSITVFAPPPPEWRNAQPRSLANRASKRRREPQPIKEWRERMASPRGQVIFRRRRLIERLNAQVKNRGFDRVNVRGLFKTQAVALWQALAHNLMTAHRLRTAAA